MKLKSLNIVYIHTYFVVVLPTTSSKGTALATPLYEQHVTTQTNALKNRGSPNSLILEKYLNGHVMSVPCLYLQSYRIESTLLCPADRLGLVLPSAIARKNLIKLSNNIQQSDIILPLPGIQIIFVLNLLDVRLRYAFFSKNSDSS